MAMWIRVNVLEDILRPVVNELSADDLEVVEETVLDILATLPVEPVRRISLDGASQVHPQFQGDEGCIWAHIDCVVCLVQYRFLLLAFNSNWQNKPPIQPALSSRA